ncbi:MAG TPA: M14 family metallopeptidase, partial [Desulfatiglandales bacterium]
VLKKRDSLTSLSRMRLLKPTFLFNARHHANEVSSTNATLFMAWFLGTTPLGQDLLKHVNVAWIPLENPDGVATLEELLPYGRDHKLHAARYNALGVETYGEYFDDKPRFPEALAKARLWHRWLPEVMVDHHGVPSHEWDQPFSGYAPFRFREFWIPRNFVYACIPFVDESGHAHHKTAMGLSTLMGKAMSGVPEIVQQNRQLASRYRRYARGPEPETFPDSKGEPMLVVPPLGRTYRTNFAVRYPEVTRSEIILEVPDEVASGRHLELCVQVHLKAEETLLRAFRRTKGYTESALDSKTGLLRLKWVPGVWRLEIPE